MTSILSSSREGFELYGKSSSTKHKIIAISAHPFINLAFEKAGRGGRRVGRYFRVTEIFIDSQNRAYAQFLFTDESGKSQKLAKIGRLLTDEELEARIRV